VRRYMTADPVTVPPGASIRTLARMIRDSQMLRVIVVHEEYRPLGIVTASDIMDALADAEDYPGLGRKERPGTDAGRSLTGQSIATDGGAPPTFVPLVSRNNCSRTSAAAPLALPSLPRQSLLFSFCFAEMGRLGQGEEHDFFARHRADVMVKAEHFGAGNVLDHRFQ